MMESEADLLASARRYSFRARMDGGQRREGSVLRFVPPMSTTDTQLDRAAQLLDDAFAAALAT